MALGTRTFGSPVVPLENNRAASVFFEVSRSSNRSQSDFPWSSNVRHDFIPGGTSWPGFSKTSTFDLGSPLSSAATKTFLVSSGSTMKNLTPAALMACLSS